MAKSLRSKRKRKIRAEKRIVNAKKELVKLKQVAARLHGESASKMLLESDIPDVRITETPMSIDGQPEMSTSKRKRANVINNQWMNQRKIKAIKSKIKKHNKKKSQRTKPAGLSSRKTKKSLRR